MEEIILREFLIQGNSISIIVNKYRNKYHLTKNEVINILDKYNIKLSNKMLLRQVFKKDEEMINKNIKSIMDRVAGNNIIIDYRVLKLFLVHGYSKRSMCRMINEIKDISGSKAQRITNKYNLLTKYRGCLFLHSKKSYENIIRNILINKSVNEDELHINFDRFTKKYRGIIIHIDNKIYVENIYNTLNGELRNLIQNAFKDLKEDIGICQFKGCECKTNIQSAHSCEKGKSRPDIFKKCIEELEDKNNINVEAIIKNFLMKHHNHTHRRKKVPPILYLCEKHHKQYDRLSKNKNLEENGMNYEKFIKNLII